MPESYPAGFVGPTETPLDELSRDITQGLQDHRFTDDQTARMAAAVHEHEASAEQAIHDAALDVHGDLVDSVGDAKNALQGLTDAHGGALDPKDAEPREMVTVVEPIVHGVVDAQADVVGAVYDVVQERIDTWRELVEIRAESGDESPETIHAQHAQLDQAQAQLDADHDRMDDGVGAVHDQIDAAVDYTVQHNAYPAELHQVSDTPHYGDTEAPDASA